MTEAASALDAKAMSRARALLAPPQRQYRIWPVLAAAAFLAITALTFAAAMILEPPLTSEHVAHQRGAS